MPINFHASPRGAETAEELHIQKQRKAAVGGSGSVSVLGMAIWLSSRSPHMMFIPDRLRFKIIQN